MTHNGIDIDQYLLLTFYPAAVFFGLGFVAKKTHMRAIITYTLQAVSCLAFSVAYFVAVPNGGAEGLALVLGMFGLLLLFMARKHKIHPEEQQPQRNNESTGQ